MLFSCFQDVPETQTGAKVKSLPFSPIPAKEYIKEQIRRYSELTINRMSFYTEHVVKTESHPGFAPDGAIPVEEFRENPERFFLKNRI